MAINKPILKNGLSGYTLVEVMVAVAVFFTIMAAPSGFFIMSLQGQQKALSSQELMDNVSYDLEYMSRALRMAEKDIKGECIAKNKNYEITPDGKGIEFMNYQGFCQKFFWDTADSRLKESKAKGAALPLTSANLEVVSFKLGPDVSWGQDDNIQPRVTFYLDVRDKRNVKPEFRAEIKIQTTVSQRALDVVY